ncbi:MAG: GntR family transcriptional regulator [Actinomycetota bacterium]|nr:GntR family transcriptional regulator [Actinomycetota bacterium]
MLIRVDPGSNRTIHEQIADAIRGALGRGEVQAGQRLPTSKELAEATGVNVHTVLRAYAELRDEGLIELRPRRGAVVSGSGPSRARLVDEARSLVSAAQRQGLSRADILELVASQL